MNTHIAKVCNNGSESQLIDGINETKQSINAAKSKHLTHESDWKRCITQKRFH